MSKKIIISAVSLTLAIALVFVFSSCGKSKDVYTDPQTGKSYILVTDENGETELCMDSFIPVFGARRTSNNSFIILLFFHLTQSFNL